MGFEKFRRKVVGTKADFSEQVIVKKGVLLTTASPATGGGVFSLLNPLGVRCIVTKCVIDITTASGGLANNIQGTPLTIDVGCQAATGATSDDSLMDGADVASPLTGQFDNITHKGTCGSPTTAWGATQYLTVTTTTGTPTGFVGNIYIWFRKA